MKVARATLKSCACYSQSKHINAAKLEKESPDDYERRTWKERLHVTTDGRVFIPPMSFKNSLTEVAKFLSMKIKGQRNATYTKHFTAGVLVTEPLVLQTKADDVQGEWLFVPADGVRGSGKRVMKCFPRIDEWHGDVLFHVLDDTITEPVFEEHLRNAGQFIGIGRFRPMNNGYYGRFNVQKISWM